MASFLGLRLVQKLPKINIIRTISTSNKKSEISTASPPIESTEACEVNKKEEKQHWQSYGFSEESETDDLNRMHSHGFFFISVALLGGIFILTYRPDVHLDDWSTREGFLELRRREQLGLPPIDPNYIDPATILLPSEEELGNTEIII